MTNEVPIWKMAMSGRLLRSWLSGFHSAFVIPELVIALVAWRFICRRLDGRLLFFQWAEIPLLAAGHETLRNRLQLFPGGAYLFGFFRRDLIIRRRRRDHREQIGKFLHDLVRRRNKVGGMWFVYFGVKNEETTRSLADPLNQSAIIGALKQGINPVQRIGAAAPGRWVGRFRPFINHGEREPEF